MGKTIGPDYIACVKQKIVLDELQHKDKLRLLQTENVNNKATDILQFIVKSRRKTLNKMQRWLECYWA